MGGATVMLSFLCQANPRARAGPEHSKRLAAGSATIRQKKTRTYEGMIRTQAMAEMGVEPPTRRPVALDLVISF